MNKFNVAGVAIGIVQNGKLAYTRGYGVRSIESEEAVKLSPIAKPLPQLL